MYWGRESEKNSRPFLIEEQVQETDSMKIHHFLPVFTSPIQPDGIYIHEGKYMRR